MIKIGLVSDLHTEFWRHSDTQNIAEVIQRRLADADLILMPGDIGVGIASATLAKLIFPNHPVYLLAGNHEFYHGDYERVLDMLASSATDNVHFLHKTSIETTVHGMNLRIIGTTLWTDFDLLGTPDLSLFDGRALNDFHHITYRGRVLRPADTLDWHREQWAWLNETLNRKFDGLTILMTHHAPVSFASGPKYVGDRLSPCFASRHEDALVRDDLPLVVWGHTHHCVDRTIEQTRFVSNQTGYPGWVSGSTWPTETGEFGQIIELP
jgi:predicted phosphodiesterase